MATFWKLNEVLEAAARGRDELPCSKLYLPRNKPWEPDTTGIFFDDADARDEHGQPFLALLNDLEETLDGPDLEYVISYADNRSGSNEHSARVYTIRYYLNSQEIPDVIGIGLPPTREEIIAGLDQKFYDLLGPERTAHKCKATGCEHGAIEHSLLCRRHHFENIKGRPCPFND